MQELRYGQKSDTYILSLLRRARDNINHVLPYLSDDLYEDLYRALIIINRIYDKVLDGLDGSS